MSDQSDILNPSDLTKTKWETLCSNIQNLESPVLDTFPFKIGRSKSCNLLIEPKHLVTATISKEHFILTKNLETNETYLTDLSKNGTFMNNRRVKKGIPVRLKDGNQIGFCIKSNEFVYRQFSDDIPNTLSRVTESDSEVNININPAWGRLISCMLHLTSVDLIKFTFKVGKTVGCDLKIDQSELSKGLQSVFSREHFTIHKYPDHPIAYIIDHSSYGTYLNGILIGKNKTFILQNDDVISVGSQKIPIFVYKRMYSMGASDLPTELRRQYEPVKLVGKGAVGEVTLVLEKTTCEMFAIKRILKAKNTLSQMCKLNHPSKIQSEISILKQISHPFIIYMKDAMEYSDEVFLVLEYMRGGELTNRIGSSMSLNEGNVKVLFYQMVKAIEFLHSKGITHRDLKPENVLLATEDIETLVKVSDFGLSKINEENTMKTFCGTLQYIAPELFDQTYNKQVDIWSLGVILFYMLSKKLPFGYNKLELYNRIKSGSYELGTEWNNISEEAIDLVQNMLIVKPENRITITEILEHPWLAKDTTMQNKVQFLLEHNLVDPKNIIAPTSKDPPKKRLRLDKSAENTS